MDREYFIYGLRAMEKKGYIIWFSGDDRDGVWLNSEGFCPLFPSIQALKNSASDHEIDLVEGNPNILDLNSVIDWLRDPSKSSVDATAFLDAWNLFDDLCQSVHGKKNSLLANAAESSVYDKLFFGNNIPAINQGHPDYQPQWSLEELLVIKEVMERGFDVFFAYIREVR